MAGDPYKKVRAGEKMEIPAEGWNGALDAARWYKNNFQNQRAPGLGYAMNSGCTIPVKNNTGSCAQRYDIVMLDSPVISPDVNDSAFQSNPAMIGIAPVAGGSYAVYQRTVQPGGMGDAMIIGVTPVRLTATITPSFITAAGWSISWQNTSWALVALGAGGSTVIDNGLKVGGPFSNQSGSGIDSFIIVCDMRRQNPSEYPAPTLRWPHLWLYGCMQYQGGGAVNLLADIVLSNGSFTGGKDSLPTYGAGLLPGQSCVIQASQVAAGFPVGGYAQGKYELRLGASDTRRMTVSTFPYSYSVVMVPPSNPSTLTSTGFHVTQDEYAGAYFYPNVVDYPNIKFMIASNELFYPGKASQELILADTSVNLSVYSAAGKICAIEPLGSQNDILVAAYCSMGTPVNAFIPTGSFKG